MRVIELFAGIGAWKKALNNLYIKNYSVPIEIDKDTFWAYQAIHKRTYNDTIMPTDITKLKIDYLQADLIVMSPPCQNYSKAKQCNKRKTDNLISYTFPIIKQTMPRYVICENVPQFEKSRDYNNWAIEMNLLGYKEKSTILNPLNYNWPQNRPRFFAIWFRDNKDYWNYQWPKEEILTKTVNDVLKNSNNDFTEKYVYYDLPNNAKLRKNGNGYIWGKYIDNRCYLPNRYIGTITATYNQPWLLSFDKTSIRKLTPLENALLMGFNKSDHQNILKSNNKLSNTKIKRMYGNSIVIPQLEKLLKGLNFKENNNGK